MADEAAFTAFYDRIVPGANKYMATLFNTSSTRKVVIRKIWLVFNNFTAVTGVALDCYLARITARTAGTSVTLRAADSNDTISAGITADHNSTSVTEAYIFKRVVASAEEQLVTVTGVKTYNIFQGILLYEKKDGERGETLRTNQGLTIRNITSSVVGTQTYIIEFTDEAA